MATELVYQQQLQALATATANFANDKDAAIKATIINALENKPEPTFTIGNGTYTYNGDGDVYAYSENKGIVVDRVNKTFSQELPTVEPYTLTLHATETANFAAKTVTATIDNMSPTG